MGFRKSSIGDFLRSVLPAAVLSASMSFSAHAQQSPTQPRPENVPEAAHGQRSAPGTTPTARAIPGLGTVRIEVVPDPELQKDGCVTFNGQVVCPITAPTRTRPAEPPPKKSETDPPPSSLVPEH